MNLSTRQNLRDCVCRHDVDQNRSTERLAAGVLGKVNEVGAAPGDLMAILEALKEAGALRAELIII